MERIAALADRLLTLGDELERHPDVEVLRWYGVPAEAPPGLEWLEETHGVTLPADFIAFYQRVDEIRLEWRAAVEGRSEKVYGRLHIQNPYVAIEGPDGAFWKDILWLSSQPEDARERLKPLRPFDSYYPDDSGFVCFELDDDGGFLDTLSIYQTGLGPEISHGLGVSLERYLTILLECRGYEGARYHIAPYVTPSLDTVQAIRRSSMKRDLAALFPGVDLSWVC